MKEQKATKVGCQACKTNKRVLRTHNFFIISGSILFVLSMYGTVRLIMDIISLF